MNELVAFRWQQVSARKTARLCRKRLLHDFCSFHIEGFYRGSQRGKGHKDVPKGKHLDVFPQQNRMLHWVQAACGRRQEQPWFSHLPTHGLSIMFLLL